MCVFFLFSFYATILVNKDVYKCVLKLSSIRIGT